MPYAFGMFAPPVLPLPQHAPPPGMISLAPGIYAFLPGASPIEPGTLAHNPQYPPSHPYHSGGLGGVRGLGGGRAESATGWSTLAAGAAVVASAGYLVKRYLFDSAQSPVPGATTTLSDLNHPGHASNSGNTMGATSNNSTDDASSSSNSSTATGKWDDARPPRSNSISGPSSSSSFRQGAEGASSSASSGDPFNLDRLTRLSAEAKEDGLARNISEMNAKVTNLAEQMKSQSTDLAKALEVFQQTLSTLKANAGALPAPAHGDSKHAAPGNALGSNDAEDGKGSGSDGVGTGTGTGAEEAARARRKVEQAIAKVAACETPAGASVAAFRNLGLYLQNTLQKPETFGKISLSNGHCIHTYGVVAYTYAENTPATAIME
jgi:hypothetical protein